MKKALSNCKTGKTRRHLVGPSILALTLFGVLGAAHAQTANTDVVATLQVNKGVVMTSPGAGTPAAKRGFKRGDIIIGINNLRITKTSDLQKATGEQGRFWRIMGIHEGQPFDVTFASE